MGSKEAGKCTLTNSESDSEVPPSLALGMKGSLDPNRQVRKRNKALQVRFKDICEAQNEQREAARREAAKGGPYKVAYRKYMTVPARRSIPNVTKSTGVQTSPDLRKRYKTFPFERKKGHTVKHVVAVESFRGHDNGFVIDVHPVPATERLGEPPQGEGAVDGGDDPRALLRPNECVATVESHSAGAGGCLDGPICPDSPPVGCPKDTRTVASASNCSADVEYQFSSTAARREQDPSAKRQLLNFEDASGGTLRDTGSRVTGPIAWNSLTQVECLESPSTRGKRKKGQSPCLNGLPREGCPAAQARCHPLRAVVEQTCPGSAAAAAAGGACHQIVPVAQDGDLKVQLQVMENLISSSQETIKVLLGVIQELEKGEAHREGLSYRTGQDTANCDTCRNSACIIYSVELDFKHQEEKLQPLMKKLCPTDDPQLPSLPYPQEAFTSTPKRKSKTESKKHARWKLWFL